MVTAALLCRLALLAAMASAWPLARLVPRYIHVARVLTACWALDLARGALRVLVLQGNHAPPAWAMITYQGATLAFPALSGILALVVFRGWNRRIMWGWVVWAVVTAASAALPLSSETWEAVVGRAHGVSVAVQIAALLSFLHGTKTIAASARFVWSMARAALFARDPAPTRRVIGWLVGVPERACLVLLAGDVAALLGPWLAAPTPHWPIWQAQGAICYGVLALLELKWARARRANIANGGA